MGIRVLGFRLALIILFFHNGTSHIFNCKLYEKGNIYKQEKTTNYMNEDDNNESDGDDLYNDIYDAIELDNIDKSLKAGGISLNISVRDMIKDITKDNTKGIKEKLKEIIKEAVLGEISDNKNLMIMLISVVLLGSIFVNLSGTMGNGFISENGFYITYLIITAVMLTSFMITLEMVEAALKAVITMIKLIIPFYALAINFIGHTSSAAAMYGIIMVGIWLVEAVILNIIIPMIRFYVIVTLVNNLNKEDYFSKLCKLINNLVNWILKTVVFFIAGLNIIKSLIEPHIDMLGKNAASKLVSALPSGSMISVLTGTFLGAGIVVKNSIGVAGIIIICFLIMAPVIKTLFVMLIIRLTSVILQPIGEKRYIEGLEGLAQGIKLLLLCLFSSAVLFVLTIAIMAYATNSGGGFI